MPEATEEGVDEGFVAKKRLPLGVVQIRGDNRGSSAVAFFRLAAFDKLAAMLADHLDGILNHCRTPVRFGVVEAINGNIKALIRRGRGYTNLRYLLLKAQRIVATKTEFVAIKKAA